MAQTTSECGLSDRDVHDYTTNNKKRTYWTNPCFMLVQDVLGGFGVPGLQWNSCAFAFIYIFLLGLLNTRLVCLDIQILMSESKWMSENATQIKVIEQ